MSDRLVIGGWFDGVVIPVWVDTGASGTSVVPAIGWNGRVCRCVRVLVLLTGVSSAGSGAGVTSLVRCASSISVLRMVGRKSSTTNSAEFSIFVGSGLVGLGGASAFEPTASGAGCVIVLWGWAITLLALVMTGEP